MSLRVLALLAALAVGATACGGEAPPYDDGGQGVPLAGLGPQVEAAGVEVLDDAVPSEATPVEVVAALEGEDLDRPTTAASDDPPPALDLGTGGTAGLLAVVSTSTAGQAVVLVFASPANAAVFAAGDPAVYAEDSFAAAAQGILTGNVVAYVADSTVVEQVRRALVSLA